MWCGAICDAIRRYIHNHKCMVTKNTPRNCIRIHNCAVQLHLRLQAPNLSINNIVCMVAIH